MLYMLLGPDDYSKKIFITALVEDKGADLVAYHQDEEIPQVSRLIETDLFAKAKVFVFEGILPEIGGWAEKLATSQNQVIISIDKIDKRKKENKDLFSQKGIEIKEFNLPHNLELNKWLEQRVKELEGVMSKPAIEELAVRLGRDNAKETKVAGKVVSQEEIYNLWQAESEIKKLIMYARGRRIELEDISSIVPQNLEVDVFEIINAIGEDKKQLALDLMQKFLQAVSSSDEKSAVIQLNALLSEQMRSLAIMQDFLKTKTPDDKIAKTTGWKSGRVYVMKKVASRLSPLKVLETMKKLEALDEELKTSQTPPRVLLDLIVAQIF
ncbi:MAG: hypothetical protein HYZ51_02040 [Candidatus Doudnabacteria bacterium]|nr:hypothetical protein [Candidatus Doudnabacteria bacterium]